MNLSSAARPFPGRESLHLHTMVLELGGSLPLPSAHSFLLQLTSCLYLFACVPSWHDVPLTRLSSFQCCMGIHTHKETILSCPTNTHVAIASHTNGSRLSSSRLSSIKRMYISYDGISFVSCSSEVAKSGKFPVNRHERGVRLIQKNSCVPDPTASSRGVCGKADSHIITL